MAPSKSPVFAVCGGVSVETVVVGVGRRRSSVKTTRRSSVAGLAESLYADLLWDCGGGNVERDPAAGAPLSTETAPHEDFTDVFGGPPKFASLSSQLSFKRGMARVSDACTNGASVFQPFASDVSRIESACAFDALNVQPRLCASQEAIVNLTPLPSATKFSKLRSTTETKFSSRICYSDSEKKMFKRKEEAAIRGVEIPPSVSPGPSAGVKTASTTMRRRESSRSDGGEESNDTRVLRPSRRDLATMKENIQASSKGLGQGEHEAQLASVHARMTSSSRESHESAQKSSRSAQNTNVERQRHNLKLKKRGNADDVWVTIKDVQLATEPSRYPPPSRPPPVLNSDAVYAIRNTYKAVKRVDEWPKRSSQSLQKESNSDSGSLSSPCTQGSFTSNPKDVKDAVEMAEAKIRMVLEARGKAKLMVEKKLREKQRARQHKERIATEGKLGTEHNCKEHSRDLREEKAKLRVRHCEDSVDRQEAEGARKRDIARQCIERAARELRSKSEAIIQERADGSRTSHDSSERLCEDGKEACSALSSADRMTAGATPMARHFWSETNAGPQKGCSRKAGLEKVVVEEEIFVSREQQQDSLSSSLYYTEQQRFSESPGLERVQSMSRTHDDWNLFPGGNSCSLGFQEIIGETSERRKARWDRHCRTAARMAKALEEKKLRDLERQREQAERHRAGEMMDEEIKGWAAGKEGNLEALLCNLHYVLWPECGWERVSPADLSTAAAVKKAYRRATLCVHPDKVQQKGATVAQKYIAEKVFDLLKDASAKYT